MADEQKPKMVKVEAIEAHTAFGKSYNVGDVYELDEQYVDSVATQGKAIRTDRVQVAKAAAKEAEKATAGTEQPRRGASNTPKAKAAKGKPVAPMGTDTPLPAAAPKAKAKRAAKGKAAK